jgi:hypothetical protein
MLMDDVGAIVSLVAGIKKDLDSIGLPPEQGYASHSYQLLPKLITHGTRGYIEKTSQQINGCYENGWYDACAVMMRKLLETVIIEVFESMEIEAKIKNPNGDYHYLGELIDVTLKQTEFSLGRNVKRGLPRLKEVGDKAAHSRKTFTHRQYIDELKGDFREAVEELLVLSKLKY